MNTVRTSSEIHWLVLSSAKNTCLDIVHKWQLGLTFFPNVELQKLQQQTSSGGSAL